MAIRKCYGFLAFYVVATVGFFFILYELALIPTEQVQVNVKKITSYDISANIKKPYIPAIYSHHAAGANLTLCDDLLTAVLANKSIYINESEKYRIWYPTNMGVCNYGNMIVTACSSKDNCVPCYDYIDPNGNYYCNNDGKIILLTSQQLWKCT